MLIDECLANFEDFREYLDVLTTEDLVNEVDGVVYPTVSEAIPEVVKTQILKLLGNPSKYTMFIRKSSANVHCPNQAHTDNSMGQYTFMLYLNRPEHCQGGTSLIYHRATGIAFAPEDERVLNLIKCDYNKPEAWAMYDMIAMKPNRAAIFPSNRFHRAEPVGGFGETNEDSRMVLTCFFDPEEV